MTEKARQIDVLVIGGGVNGAGIARDLAGRGLSVVLCEKGDLASATSASSSKMIHGGLRYLEQYDFKLVRESLREREALLRSAPHIIRPMNFVLPHRKQMRPWWMTRIGLFIYDFLGGRRTLPASKGHFLPGTRLGQPLKLDFKRGFTYSDCWVEDTRLVVLCALDAAEKGAHILTRTACTHLSQDSKGGGWTATLQDQRTEKNFRLHARMVVNASGPWVNKTLEVSDNITPRHQVRWVKGSHMIVPRLYQGEHAYLLQNDDARVVFVFPYEKRYSLIGTTDVEYKGDLEEIRASVEEVEYLCRAVNTYFRQQLKPEDVQWTYSGVRPLIEDGEPNASKVSREYVLDMDEAQNPPILSVYGGKLTTFRSLSEHAGDMVVKRLGKGGGPWTEVAPLPGGEGSGANFETFVKTVKREYNWLPEGMALRLCRAYGTRAREILRGCKRISDMGVHFGADIYECELNYLVEVEWAQTLEDVLWRRSKLGLHLDEDTQERIGRALAHMVQAKTEAA